jgi:hypothetical protein
VKYSFVYFSLQVFERVGKPEGKEHAEGLGIDGKIILELILEWMLRK